jgi:glycosyltransferase involved in cell wall biosynthesis
MKTPLRIAFINARDARDVHSWSGLLYWMHDALSKRVRQVEILGPYQPAFANLVNRHFKRIHSLIGMRHGSLHTVCASLEYSKFFSRCLNDKQHFDLIFAPSASTEIAFLRTDIPIIYLADATFGVMLNYYYEFTKLSSMSRYEGNLIERRAINKASHCVFPSKWAAQSAIEQYGASEDAVSVIPFGINLDPEPTNEEIEFYNRNGRCRLLFVGQDWKRKGAALAAETLEAVRRQGIDAELNIVGCNPEIQSNPYIKIIPFLSKKNSSDSQYLRELYRSADFFILPTRAECFGIVFAEASAFGVPSVATNTGGVPDAVINGVNGILLEPDANAESYAQSIIEHWTNPKRYNELRKTTRKRYVETLNWNAWAESIMQLIIRVVQGHQK